MMREVNDNVKLCPNCRSFNDLSESNICQYCDFDIVEGKVDEKPVGGKVFKGFYLSVTIFPMLLAIVLVIVGGVKEPPADVESFIAFYKLLIALLIVSMLISGIAMLSLLYQAWASIQDGHARTTPGRAVGFMFIPVFSLYWSFRVIYGFAEDYNRFLDRYQIKAKKLSLFSFGAYTVLSITSWIPLPFTSWIPLPFKGLLNLYLLVLHFFVIARTCDAINALASNTEGVNTEGVDAEDGEKTYELSPPPVRSDHAASYCPICKGEFREGFSYCNSCQVALTPYDMTP